MSANNPSAVRAQRWPSLETLLEKAGHVTIGHVAPIDGVAIAATEDALLATIVRHEGESFEDLLQRLDDAVGRALNEGIHTNEIEGGRFMLASPRKRRRRTDGA